MLALLGKGATNDQRSNAGNTPLILAASEGYLSVVEVLLEDGADCEIRHKSSGQTAVAFAVRYGHAPIMLALLQREAKVNAKGNNGYTLLHRLSRYQPVGGEVAVDLLLRWGADETILDVRGNSPTDLLDQGGSSRWSDDEVDRVRHLLVRALVDRAWRRRSGLVMIRSHLMKTAARTACTSLAAGEDGGCRKMARSPGMLEGKVGWKWSRWRSRLARCRDVAASTGIRGCVP